jgi:hypothetical protein
MMTFAERFTVQRPLTLELFMPQNLRTATVKTTSADFCEAVFDRLDDFAKSHIQCIQQSKNGSNSETGP